MAQMVMEARARNTRGKGAARVLRRAGQIPGVIYGAHKDPVAISLDPRSVEKLLRSEHGHNVVLTLSIEGGDKASAMICDWQVDPVKGHLLHVDFLRVAMDEKVRVKVPVHLDGLATGVKNEGGVQEILLREIEVECLPGDIPEEFRVDVSGLSLNQGIRVGELELGSDKIRLLIDEAQVLVHVLPPRVQEEEKPAEEEATAEEAAEPEVIGRGKAEEEGAPAEETEKKKK